MIKSAIRTNTIQAPCMNLVLAIMTVAMPVATAPTPFTTIFSANGVPLFQPTQHHAGLRQREGHKHTDRIERNQCVGVPVEYDQKQTGEKPENENTIGEYESITKSSPSGEA